MISNCWTNKAEFKERVYFFADKIGIKIRCLYLRPMKNKWASCSTNGNLNFNVELLEIERDLGEYVIVHELLHFHTPNHSKLWKSRMSSYLGEYEKLELRLNKYCIN